MRDIVFVLLVGGLLPVALLHPWVGIMLWTWLSVMNPHRLMWTVNNWPFAAAVALATLLGVVLTRDKRSLPITSVTVVLALFAIWICIATNFAFAPEPFGDMFKKVMKVLFMIFVALVVLHEKRHIEWLVWVLALSVGFYGIKGGIFTLATGGNFLVWGPAGSFIEGNNEIALALVLIIPLFYFLHSFYANKWIKYAMIASMSLCAIAALGSHSRGALLAIGAMGIFLWWRSDKKLVVGVMLILVAAGSLAVMPAEWWTRMETISTYQQDASAMGRINAWHAMWNLATEHVFGGGFDIYTPEVFMRYAPNPTDVHAAHSIYFQVLGEHGFIGLFLFMLIWFLTWRSASWIYHHTKADADMRWAANLASMCQVSLVGYAVGGAFLSLAYFDLPYDILVVVVVLRRLVERHLHALEPVRPPIPSLSITPAR